MHHEGRDGIRVEANQLSETTQAAQQRGWYHNPTYSHDMRITNLPVDVMSLIGKRLMRVEQMNVLALC